MARRTTLLMLLALTAAIAACAEDPPAFETETLRGRVVFLAEALQRKFGVETAEDARERILAVETKDGQLLPLVEDSRGRAFRADQRLRNMEVELTVRRFEGAPAVQVLRVCELNKDGKFEIDYWCDVCSITMFEMKECECCQQPNVLRRRKVEK